MEDGDGDWRCRSSSKPFEAGSRGTLGRRFRAEKGGAQGGRYRPVIRGKRLIIFVNILSICTDLSKINVLRCWQCHQRSY